jgi:hypothetical protein
MAGCDKLLRRRFIAIATDRFVAEATFQPLDVASEVAAMRRWLCDPNLDERGFKPGFKRLAARPSYDAIKADLVDNGRFSDADAVVLYVTGHGAVDVGRHRIVLNESDPAKLATTALATTDLVVWLAQQQGLGQVLLIIDLCEAGDVHEEIVRDVLPVLPGDWIVLLSTSPGADAKVGALTGVISSVIDEIAAGANQHATPLEPYLYSDVFIRRVKELLRERHGQVLTVSHDPYRTSCCLPNPGYKHAGGGDKVKTAAARSDLAVLEEDMVAHWRRRAPVEPSPGQPPWVFTGRGRLVERLIAASTGKPGSVVVMGRAGSGKSAVLARLVTCSDPTFRAEHGDLLAGVPPVPPEGAVDVAVLATGKGPEQIAVQIGSALGVELAPWPGETALDSWLRGITGSVESRAEPITVVLDALDESSDPVGVIRSVLQRLNPPDDRRIRLLVGVRSVPGAANRRAGDLAGLAIGALDAAPVAVDADAYWEPGDLRSFVADVLGQPPSPYADHPAQATDVASAIEAEVERSYLLATLVAGELVARERPLAAGGGALAELLAGGVAEVVRQELVTSFPDADDRERALILLRATALGFGRGVPWRDVWPAAASAIAPGGRAIGDGDVAWLLQHRIAGHLVRDLEDDVTVYRPFHDALRESLAKEVERYAANPAEHPDHDEAHGLIARALLAWFDPTRKGPPPPYARRHITEHAAAADELREPFLSADTLPLLDPYALSRALRLVQVEPYSWLGLLLGAWRGVRHRWTWDRPEANAAALDMALTAAGATAAERPRRAAVSWTPRWAEWSFGGTVVGIEERALRAIALGAVAGRECLVTAGIPNTQIWDAATSEPLGPALPVPSPERIALTRTAEGEILVALAESGAQGWDAATGQLRWTSPTGFGRFLAAGDVYGRSVVAVAVAETVQLLDCATGAALCLPFGGGAHARGLALATDQAGRVRLVVGRGDGTVEQWDVSEEGPDLAVKPGPHVAELGVEVNAVAAIDYHGRFLVAIADSTGVARLRDADTREWVGPECRHEDEVRGVALADASGALLMATGSAPSSGPRSPESPRRNRCHIPAR